MRKLTIAVMMLLARRKGGRCISTLYVNSATPLLWECARAHRWNAVPSSIRKGTWCPECAGVRPSTIGEMKEIARSRGGRCVSGRYYNTSTKLTWRCSAGHEWSATPLQVKKGHWCPFCARVTPLTLPILQQIATHKGGHCLSIAYVSSTHPLQWKCASGHEWMARARSIRAGNWCPVCAHNQRLKLEEMRQIARERGGMCLSTTYKNGCTPLVWVCKFGHQWKACAANVKSGQRRKGSWCRECYSWRRRFHGKRSIEAMKDLATSREGTCLSEEYFGSKVKLLWKCEFGHRWHAAPSYVVQGTWCPVCARNQRLTLEQFQDLASKKGGACLSVAYKNERTALYWCCAYGHEWEAVPAKIKRGSWCPTCASIARRSDWMHRRAPLQSEIEKVAASVKSRRIRVPTRRRRVAVSAAS
jgi:thiol-disulfide isomerase/thioredoxin